MAVLPAQVEPATIAAFGRPVTDWQAASDCYLKLAACTVGLLSGNYVTWLHETRQSPCMVAHARCMNTPLVHEQPAINAIQWH